LKTVSPQGLGGSNPSLSARTWPSKSHEVPEEPISLYENREGVLTRPGGRDSAFHRLGAALLVLAAVAEFTGWMEKVRWGRRAAWIAGALSGAFGGLVGNQGGIRSAALLGFDIPKESFVATATAIALFVDGARLPVYLATQWNDIQDFFPVVAVATGGVVIGTFGAALAAIKALLAELPRRLGRWSVSTQPGSIGSMPVIALRPKRHR
jgi:hypothetical protein